MENIHNVECEKSSGESVLSKLDLLSAFADYKSLANYGKGSDSNSPFICPLSWNGMMDFFLFTDNVRSPKNTEIHGEKR